MLLRLRELYRTLSTDIELDLDVQIKDKLAENEENYKKAQRSALCMGFHAKVGIDSPVRKALATSPIFDRKLMGAKR